MNTQGSPPLMATLSVALVVLGACQPSGAIEETGPHLVGGTDNERGRSAVVIGGCNDCHTDGYLQTEGDVPEEQWL